MPSVVPRVTNTLISAPLPMIIEKLGISIAEAQKALDENSVAMAQQMAETEITIGDNPYNLLSLGFVPSFYSFTEATVETKMSFSMKESKEFGVDAGIYGGVAVFGAHVNISYARKFSVESKGSSSIAARLVSLPPPEILMNLLNDTYNLKANTK